MERQFKIGDLVRVRVKGDATILGFVTHMNSARVARHGTGRVAPFVPDITVTHLKPYGSRTQSIWYHPFRDITHVEAKTKE